MGVKKQLLSFILISLVLLSSGCKKNPTEPEKIPTLPTPPSLELSVDGVSCTEAWIKVKKLNDTTFLPISVKINEKEFFHGFLAAVDTVLFVESLIPNTTYTVKGIILDTLQTAEELKVTTLPTTSHNFTWQTFTFGEHSSSVLNDVAIIDENNIWAVGEIYMKDTLGNTDPNFYNLVKWNGSEWKPERIYFINSQGQSFLAPMKSIFAFNPTDILIGLDQIIKWNGNKYQSIEIPNAIFHSWINKLWGRSSNNLYVVGDMGNIAHYDGKSWQKIESGTDLDFYDIWGSYDPTTNKSEILTVARTVYDDTKQQIVRIKNDNTIEAFQFPSDSKRISSMWFQSTKSKKYFCGDGLLTYNSATGTWKKEKPWPYSYSVRVRGTAENDVYSVGIYGFTTHYNGVDWKILTNFLGNAVLGSIAIKNDLVVITGFVGSKAYLAFGRHN